MVLASVNGIAFACNLSSFTVTSIVPMPPDTMINFTVCYGGGRTGVIKGADGDTRSVAIVFRSANWTGSIVSFSPASMASIFSSCVMPGADVGAQPSPYNTVETVTYVDPGYYGMQPCMSQPFACVTSTALCGNVAQNCINYSFLVTQVPDSICVLGAEGSGNPIGGCDCSQMGDALRLGAPLLVWGDISAVAGDDGIVVTWGSFQEFESGTYHVERQIGQGPFSEIGTRSGLGATQAPVEYSFTDPDAGLQGRVGYRLRFVDQDGHSEYSPIVSVNLRMIGNFAVQEIYPLPARDVITANLLVNAAGDLSWRLIDAGGKMLINGTMALPGGESQLALDLQSLRPGNYYLQCRMGSETVTRKVIKQ